MSALGIAMEDGHTECARVLLEARADVNGKRPGDGFVIWTPLMIACDNGHDKSVELLLEHDAALDIRLHFSRCEKGQPSTAMEFAEEGGEQEAGGKRCAAALRRHSIKLQHMIATNETPWEGKYAPRADKKIADEDAISDDVAVALGLKKQSKTKQKKRTVQQTSRRTKKHGKEKNGKLTRI